jgi:hypothetical protein
MGGTHDRRRPLPRRRRSPTSQRGSIMSHIKDPAFYALRTKPLPTLAERRRFVRERLAKEEADFNRLVWIGAAPDVIRKMRANVRLLRRALAYLGRTDERFDLYRLFGMDLPPPPDPPVQLRLPLEKP